MPQPCGRQLRPGPAGRAVRGGRHLGKPGHGPARGARGPSASSFAAYPATLSSPCTTGLNPQIEVDGDTARAKWYLFMPCTVGDTGRAMWRAGLDEEEYVRVDGKWMYKSKKSAPIFHTTFEEGWAEQRFV